MKHSIRRTVAVIGAVAASASFVGTAPAQSAEVAGSHITVRSTDYDVTSGQQFRLFGRLTSEGSPVHNATVRVKTLRNGAWVQLRGAVVSTNDEGRYRVRVILSQKGQRQLRVVGDPKGDTIKTARQNVTIRVR